jgi:hypothetical protein
MMTKLQPGTLVTDRRDSSRYYQSVYRVISTAADRTVVRRVGQLEGGRLTTWGDHGETHRATDGLVEWN